MTVLQVCAYAAPYEGNFIKSLRALESELEKKHIKMIYAFPETAKKLDWVQQLEHEATVYYLPLAKARIKPATYRKLKNIFLDNVDIAVVHSHFELYDIPVVMTAPKGTKIFWHLHDAIEIYNSFRHRITHKLQYGLLHRNAILLSVSQKHMQYVLRCGFPENKAYFLPNGVDTHRIKQVSTDYKDRKYDFLIFGWEFERKGVDLCIKAICNANLNCSVAVVGTENTAEIIRERYGEIPQIKVIDPVKNINLLYADTKCFLHISRAEGLSYALLEAVYSGVPVICSDIPENRFAARFQTVSMVKNEDIDSIAVAMQFQMTCAEPEQRMVDNVRKIIDEEYSIACWVKNILSQYGV